MLGGLLFEIAAIVHVLMRSSVAYSAAPVPGSVIRIPHLAPICITDVNSFLSRYQYIYFMMICAGIFGGHVQGSILGQG